MGDGTPVSCECSAPTPAPTPSPAIDPASLFVTSPLNNGRGNIKTLIIKLFFNDEIIDFSKPIFDLNDGTWDSNIANSVSQFYKQQSFNSTNYEFTILSTNYQSTIDSTSATIQQIITDAVRNAEIDNFIYCNGICGYNNIDGNNLRINTTNYDQVIVVVNADTNIMNSITIGSNEMILESNGINDFKVIQKYLGFALGIYIYLLNHIY